MKKLNEKGFTLIELLAIIVILAIILIVTIPTVLDSINDARLSGLHSQAKEIATWYTDGVASDELAFGGSEYVQVVGDAPETLKDHEWHCLSGVTTTTGKTLFTSANDLKSDGTAYSGSGNPTASTCSSIKVTADDSVEVLLVATTGGRFQVGGADKVTFALSTASKANALS